jgi:hypothetical protein
VNGKTPAEETLRAVDAWRRRDLISHLGQMLFDIATHPDWPVPDRVVCTIEALGDGPDERQHNVLMTAIALGVSAVEDADGWLCAALRNGPVTLEARTPARKAAQAA